MMDEQDQIRRHIRILRQREQAFELAQPLSAADAVQIVQALSGG